MSRTNRKPNHLAELALFDGCSRRQLDAISSLLTEVDVEAGTVLIREGSHAREAFILGSGAVRVVTGHGTEERELGVATAGAPLGEMSILSNEPRMATVITLTPSTVFVVTPREFVSLMAEVPEFEAKILEIARQRQELNAAA